MVVAENRDRRRMPRIPLVHSLPARARGAIDVQLLDLSLGGVRVGHCGQLPPGSSCALELPPSLNSLVLTADVARSAVVGVKQYAQGERHLRYESGLAFTELTADQATTLTCILEQLTE